jgi:hypothetical protein
MTLVLDDGNGDATCPGGGSINIGTMEGGSQTIQGVLFPSDHPVQGVCP